MLSQFGERMSGSAAPQGEQGVVDGDEPALGSGQQRPSGIVVSGDAGRMDVLDVRPRYSVHDGGSFIAISIAAKRSLRLAPCVRAHATIRRTPSSIEISFGGPKMRRTFSCDA